MKAANDSRGPSEQGKCRYPIWDADDPADSIEGYYTLKPWERAPNGPLRVPCTCDDACALYCSGERCGCDACSRSFLRFVIDFRPLAGNGDWFSEERIRDAFGADVADYFKRVGRVSTVTNSETAVLENLLRFSK